MPTAPFRPDQLHDPILPHVRPAPLLLHPTETIEQALARTRELPESRIILYCYVVDDEDRLVGYVPVRRLLTSSLEAPVSSVMVDDVMAIPSWATVLVAAEYFVNHRLLAFPVVETSGKLVGVVDVTLFNDDVIGMAKQSFDGIFQLLGIHATQGLGPWAGFKDRFPWLLCNIAGGLLCAMLSSHFEELLNVAVVLALFIPIVLALAESVSIQSVTLALQNLQSGEIRWRHFGRALLQEATTAMMLGAGCGTVVGLLTWAWKREPFVSAILAVAITASMITACVFGVLFPTLLRAAKADPKIAAGPIVLALTDLATLLFYFTIAGMLLT